MLAELEFLNLFLGEEILQRLKRCQQAILHAELNAGASPNHDRLGFAFVIGQIDRHLNVRGLGSLRPVDVHVELLKPRHVEHLRCQERSLFLGVGVLAEPALPIQHDLMNLLAGCPNRGESRSSGVFGAGRLLPAGNHFGRGKRRRVIRQNGPDVFHKPGIETFILG